MFSCYKWKRSNQPLCVFIFVLSALIDSYLYLRAFGRCLFSFSFFPTRMITVLTTLTLVHRLVLCTQNSANKRHRAISRKWSRHHFTCAFQIQRTMVQSWHAGGNYSLQKDVYALGLRQTAWLPNDDTGKLLQKLCPISVYWFRLT